MKNNLPLISIIVPVYNTEKYLKRCFNQVINQKHQNYELIIIDDGSTDGSAGIIDGFLQQCPEKITVIYNENAGQGASRNIGLGIAKGDYIAFLDSDDAIYYDTYSKLLEKAQEDDFDIVVCDVKVIDEKGNKTIQKSIKDGEEYSVSSNIKHGDNFASPCNKIFKKSILENYCFPRMDYEDAAIIPVILSNHDHVGYVEEPLYNYYLRANSTSANKDSIRTLDMLKAYKMSIESVNPKYRDDLIYACTRYIVELLKNKKYKFYNQFVEFVKQNDELFETCEAIKEDSTVNGILHYFEKQEEPVQLPTPIQKEIYHPFKFSIVMAVYNVDPFIDEAIESILKQDIGFEANVQIILVDDGSNDTSGIICDKYAEKYPKNIISLHKENGGASSARNEAMKHIQGKYVNFMDPDDKLSLNALSTVYIFFETHYAEMDIVGIPLVFFDARNDQHPTNKVKFNKGTRVINLLKEYEVIHISCAASFIKYTQIDKIHFDENLHTMEDAKALIPLFIDNPKLGVVKECTYFYRKRTCGEPSQSQGASKLARWYTDFLLRFSKWCIDYSMETCGSIPLFVQYVIMYDFQWRLSQQKIPDGLLTIEEEDEYKTLLFDLLKYIDDKVIFAQKNIWSEHKLFAFNKKYNKKTEYKILPDSVMFHHQGKNIANLSQMSTNIHFVTIQNHVLTIIGDTLCFGCEENEDIPFFANVNDRPVLCSTYDDGESRYCLGDMLYKRFSFTLKLPLIDDVEIYNIKLFMIYKNVAVARNNLNFEKYSSVGSKFENSYYFKENRLVTVKGNLFTVKLCGRKGVIDQENKFENELLNSKLPYKKEAVLLRRKYFIYSYLRKALKCKPIWLISDKTTRGDDNGEAMFKFLNSSNNTNKIKSYFVIGKEFCNVDKIKKIGNTVEILSDKHKLLYLLADNNLSAYANSGILNPFLNSYEPFRDIMQNDDFIFLQHGITHNDVSGALNSFNKNMRIITTAAKKENDYINSPLFRYRDYTVGKLTGFARYDLLYNNPQRVITIAPTWRQDLFADFIAAEDRWVLKANLQSSEYYKFFMDLLNNEKLLGAAKKYSFTIHFVPHSVFFPYIDLFNVDSSVVLHSTEVSYRDMFAISNLLITDYSSVAFDFAYLRKPIIYTQFDKVEYYQTGYKQGYFDYEQDGFGEVEYDLESTISRITEYMKNDCKLKDQYRKRIDGFFEFDDKNNCQRIYDAIIEKDKE